MPFYRDLLPKVKGKINVIAVLPQSKPEAEAYLTKEGLVPGVQTASASLASIGVLGTPTLLLLDSSGKVKASWVGELPEAAQRDLLSKLLQ
jgi:hypothetical protein